MEELKLCINCKHMGEFFRCERPIGISLITGETQYNIFTCEQERYSRFGESCGKEGKYYEPRKEK